jgi:hypothetical protein
VKALTSVTVPPLQQGAGTNAKPPTPGVLPGPLQPEPLLLHLLQGVMQQQALQRQLLAGMPPPPPLPQQQQQQPQQQPQQAQSEAQHVASAADGGTAKAPHAKRHHILDAAGIAIFRLQPASPVTSSLVQQQQQQLQAPQTPPAAPLQPLHVVSHGSSNDSKGGGSICTGAQADAASEVAAPPVAALGHAASEPSPQDFYDLCEGSSSQLSSASFQMPSAGDTAEMVAATDLLLSPGANKLCGPPSAGCAIGVPAGAIVGSCSPQLRHLLMSPWLVGAQQEMAAQWMRC